MIGQVTGFEASSGQGQYPGPTFDWRANQKPFPGSTAFHDTLIMDTPLPTLDGVLSHVTVAQYLASRSTHGDTRFPPTAEEANERLVKDIRGLPDIDARVLQDRAEHLGWITLSRTQIQAIGYQDLTDRTYMQQIQTSPVDRASFASHYQTAMQSLRRAYLAGEVRTPAPRTHRTAGNRNIDPSQSRTDVNVPETPSFSLARRRPAEVADHVDVVVGVPVSNRHRTNSRDLNANGVQLAEPGETLPIDQPSQRATNARPGVGQHRRTRENSFTSRVQSLVRMARYAVRRTVS